MSRLFHNEAVMACLLLFIGSAAPAAVAAGDEAAAGPLNLQLDEAVTMALAQSPAVRAVEFQAQSAKDAASALNRSHWGELDAVTSVSRFDADRLLVPMSSQLLAAGLPSAPFDRDQLHYGLTYQVPLYLGGNMSAGIEIAKLAAAKADALREGTRWQVRFNATSLYAGVQTLDGALKASAELIRTLGAVQKRLELMVQQGKRPRLDLLKVQDQMAEAKGELASLQAQRTKVAGLLLALLGQRPDRRLSVDPLADSAVFLAATQDSLVALARASTPVLQARLTTHQAASGVKAARSAFLPSIIGRADYFGHHAGTYGDDPTTWELSLSVKLPLFNGASRFARLSSAKAHRRAAQQGLKMAQLRREAELNDAVAHLRAASAGWDAAGARVASATEAARSEQIRYNSGSSSIEDLLRAKTRQEAAATALARARGELEIAAAQINAVVEMEVVR